jgi:hypothetical protein
MSELVKFNPQGTSDLSRTIANLSILKEEDFRSVVAEHITHPFDVETPKEKVKRRPDGFDYIESSWMDKVTKEGMPLYKYSLLHCNESLGWIDIIISLEDCLTGNIELGAGSARIQVRQGTQDPPGFRDVVDKGNNLKAALTNAIKNAQSRFGYGADVYGKREGVRTKEDIERYKKMLVDVKSISSVKAQVFAQQWEELGVDFVDFLDGWQFYIDREKKRSEVSAEAKVTETIKTDQNVSPITDDKKKIKF